MEKEINGIIYMANNKINNKKYVGQTIQIFCNRKAQHKSDAKNNKEGIFHKAIRKYGWDKFEWVTLEEGIKTIKDLNEREQYWIEYYKSYIGIKDSQGYNATTGGLNYLCSDYTKNKISQNHADVSGENNGNSTIDMIIVEEIKTKLIEGKKVKDLSLEYNISMDIIQGIKTTKNWTFIRQDLNESLIKLISKRNSKEVQNKNRANIIEMYLQGFEPNIIEKRVDVSINTVFSVIRKYKKDSNIIIIPIIKEDKIKKTSKNEEIYNIIHKLYFEEHKSSGEIQKQLSVKKHMIDKVVAKNKLNKKEI